MRNYHNTDAKALGHSNIIHCFTSPAWCARIL